VGSHKFIKTVKDRLGARVAGRKIKNDADTYELRETLEPYGDFEDKENESKNLYLWDFANE